MDRRGKVGPGSRRATWLRVTATASSAALIGLLGLPGTALAAANGATRAAAPAKPATPAADSSSCHLGNGVKHVVQLTFDNVHFFRDNPNVPSDLEQLPNLLNFFEDNGTFLSNNHTPLIAHTADDILTTYTGLYGDRQGMPVSNDYQAYNKNGPDGTYGTTDSASSFAYWTDPVDDTTSPPTPGHDTNPNMVYSPVPPATSPTPVTPNTTTPAPWVPFTRAGCDVGDVATANQELENTTPDIADAFGANSPEAQQLAADPDSYKDPETADYVGVAVHCAQGSAFCADAQAVKYGQTTPSPTAVADVLPDEPGGYHGFQALFGHKYVAPQLGAGTPSLTRNGYQVTNASGNLVDLNGNEIDGALPDRLPGLPRLLLHQRLPDAGLHGRHAGVRRPRGQRLHLRPARERVHPGPEQQGRPCYNAGDALGSGSACYIAQAEYYNAAFGAFFQRLAADGITPANTLFVLSSDEGDHEAGANVGRAIQPTPASCDGVTVSGST